MKPINVLWCGIVLDVSLISNTFTVIETAVIFFASSLYYMSTSFLPFVRACDIKTFRHVKCLLSCVICLSHCVCTVDTFDTHSTACRIQA